MAGSEYHPAGTAGVAGAAAGALGAELGCDPQALAPLAGVGAPAPHALVAPGSVDEGEDDDGPQLLVLLLAAGAVPHPAGSLGVLAAAGDDVEEVDEVDDAPLSRFKNAVMSLPVGTTATTSHPSPDFSVSLPASVDASKVETLTESNSYMVLDDTTATCTCQALSRARTSTCTVTWRQLHLPTRHLAATSSRSASRAEPS